tara:strand:+ start:2359 stop:2697 length:339 start_codon:yes stop_codon:yes gene_type:complete
MRTRQQKGGCAIGKKGAKKGGCKVGKKAPRKAGTYQDKDFKDRKKREASAKKGVVTRKRRTLAKKNVAKAVTKARKTITPPKNSSVILPMSSRLQALVSKRYKGANFFGASV